MISSGPPLSAFDHSLSTYGAGTLTDEALSLKFALLRSLMSPLTLKEPSGIVKVKVLPVQSLPLKSVATAGNLGTN